ncbi:hypothetical protein B0H14DRAFT_747557 [Mycena olivaceomarginata]|nr:hypothetical protein B0H14DRAFT_747557 [Mycena olivaceomarginata]
MLSRTLQKIESFMRTQQDMGRLKRFFRQQVNRAQLEDCKMGLSDALDVFLIKARGINVADVAEFQAATERKHQELLKIIAESSSDQGSSVLSGTSSIVSCLWCSNRPAGGCRESGDTWSRRARWSCLQGRVEDEMRCGEDQRYALRVCYADCGRESRGVCVVCGGIGRSGRGALQRRGRSAGKRVGGRRNAEQAEPVRKGNPGSDEGDPKQPSVSEKEKEGRGGRGSKNASMSPGTSRKKTCWF